MNNPSYNMIISLNDKDVILVFNWREAEKTWYKSFIIISQLKRLLPAFFNDGADNDKLMQALDQETKSRHGTTE